MIRVNLAPVFVRTGSHRCRDRVARALGYSDRFDSTKPKLKYFYTWDAGGCIIAVTPRQYERIKDIPGVTRYSGRERPKECWG